MRPRPRTKDTSASALQKKKLFTKIFQAISTKKRFSKILQALHKILTIQKIVLSSSQGQANFRWLEAKDLTFKTKAKDFKMCPRGRPRGQGRPRGLHLCWLGMEGLDLTATTTRAHMTEISLFASITSFFKRRYQTKYSLNVRGHFCTCM